MQNIKSLKPCHGLLKQPAENVFDFTQKDCWGQTHEKLIDEDPLGQVKFGHLLKVTVLNLHVIMMKPETKLITLAARLFELCVLIYPS